MSSKTGLEPGSRIDVKGYLEERRSRIDRVLDEFLPSAGTQPEGLHEAMRYSLFAGGKRVRPVLAVAAMEALEKNWDRVLPLLSAIELIHTYSLIHDDLPAMDNDDLRRGRPTSHRKFGEAAAILAGDGLLTAAFGLVADRDRTPSVSDEIRVAVAAELADGSGSAGMVGGQFADIQAQAGGGEAGLTAEALRWIHERKTGRLIRSAVRIGALVGGAGSGAFAALSEYGERVGLAFQVADDILDAEGTQEETGKRVGKDGTLKKLTYPGVSGLEASRRLARELTAQAIEALREFGPPADPLRAIARFVVERKH